jgi:hypothetical protein
MPTVARPRLHHLALTVTDLDASMRWYQDVFDVTYQMDGPHPGGVGKVLADPTWELMIVLHHHDTNDANPFAETTTPGWPSPAAPTSKPGKPISRPTASLAPTPPTNRSPNRPSRTRRTDPYSCSATRTTSNSSSSPRPPPKAITPS